MSSMAPHDTNDVCAVANSLCDGSLMRFIRLIYLCIRLHSISLALWVDAYTNFKPTHGGK